MSYRPPGPSYAAMTAEKTTEKHSKFDNPKAEHVSSLAPPTRGYVPPIGPKTTVAPPPIPYHSPRPSYMSSIYPSRSGSGYVPPSSGNATLLWTSK